METETNALNLFSLICHAPESQDTIIDSIILKTLSGIPPTDFFLSENIHSFLYKFMRHWYYNKKLCAEYFISLIILSWEFERCSQSVEVNLLLYTVNG